MPLKRSFEKSEGRFVSIAPPGRAAWPPSGTLLGGKGSGDGGVGVVGRGKEGGAVEPVVVVVVVTRLSATSVSRRAVGAPAVLSTVNFSCRYRASVSKLGARERYSTVKDGNDSEKKKRTALSHRE
jgi:hypothetical protein